MTSKAERQRNRKVATIARANEMRVAKPGRASTPAAVPKVVERKGLEWLLHKKRITARQFWAGTVYGELYRAAAINGVEPIKSAINFDLMGNGDGVRGLSHAERDLAVQDKLSACHMLALGSETNMIATVAAICGRQLTPREITTDHAETVEIETTLRLALNLLANHLECRKMAA